MSVDQWLHEQALEGLRHDSYNSLLASVWAALQEVACKGRLRLWTLKQITPGAGAPSRGSRAGSTPSSWWLLAALAELLAPSRELCLCSCCLAFAASPDLPLPASGLLLTGRGASIHCLSRSSGFRKAAQHQSAQTKGALTGARSLACVPNKQPAVLNTMSHVASGCQVCCWLANVPVYIACLGYQVPERLWSNEAHAAAGKLEPYQAPEGIECGAALVRHPIVVLSVLCKGLNQDLILHKHTLLVQAAHHDRYAWPRWRDAEDNMICVLIMFRTRRRSQRRACMTMESEQFQFWFH